MIAGMYPILARYGSIFIYSYTVVLALGVLAAILLIRRSPGSKHAEQWFDALLVVIVAAVVGGRMGFVLWRWDYFQEHLTETWQIWQGGLSYFGALFAAILTLALWTTSSSRSFSRYAALFAPALLLVTLFGWFACWLEGCAYGQETFIGWLAVDLPDEYGVSAVRYQTQIVGFVLTAVCFIFFLRYQRNQSPLTIFLLALASVSLVHLLVTFLRADPTFFVGGLRVDAIINALLVTISLLLLQYQRVKARRVENRA